MSWALRWAAALLLVGQSFAVDVDVTIQTATPPFTLRGERGGDVNYFYGVPFTKPRVPPHRFALPEDFDHAGGSIYSAKDQKQSCVNAYGQGGEDCLYMDIYMPATTGPTPTTYPVLFWIFGGSWMSGSKNDYSGVLWASQNWTDEVDRVVVVTVNYRLNILGYPDVDGVPTNLGMHDNIQALRWVKDHIGNFGGDTNRITIHGESAGAMNVLQLWTSPAARGLFHRAIAQSPYLWYYPNGTTAPDASARAARRARQAACLEQAKAAACAQLPGGVNDSACSFQTPTLEDLTNVTGCFGAPVGPVSEDGLISDTFQRDWCGGRDAGYGVPLLVGHNGLEVNFWRVFGGYPGQEANMHRWVDYLAPLANGTSIFQCLGDLYEASGRMQDLAPTSVGQAARDVYATSGVHFNTVSETLVQLPHVHMFLFNESADHMGDLGGGRYLCQHPLGAHTCEAEFVMTDTTMYYANGTNVGRGAPMDTEVQRNMRKAWASFATHANPGWAHDEIGVFMDNELVIRPTGHAFIPAASKLLAELVCHPSAIAPTCPVPTMSRTYTCAEIKRLYTRDSQCCGSPSSAFHF